MLLSPSLSSYTFCKSKCLHLIDMIFWKGNMKERNSKVTLPLPSQKRFGPSNSGETKKLFCPSPLEPFWPISEETKQLLCPSPLITFMANLWRNQTATLPLLCYNSCKALTQTSHTEKLLCPSPLLPKPFCHINNTCNISNTFICKKYYQYKLSHLTSTDLWMAGGPPVYSTAGLNSLQSLDMAVTFT